MHGAFFRRITTSSELESLESYDDESSSTHGRIGLCFLLGYSTFFTVALLNGLFPRSTFAQISSESSESELSWRFAFFESFTFHFLHGTGLS